ncbi:hypothetical protein STCU_00376 [Strigomonas culicis]|nr:hypothetical protein STCU_01364 [Strigomonas culicis]EPY36849.1 hypothetical protein STCU_00376 [Strigomonas culicis]|eukprot:EPY34738.1 hypothetical protein STCU_01364 [Strigomonas culicis]
MNDLFWFTEQQKIVKKGLQFELEPSISVEVTVDCKMQLTSIACPCSVTLSKGTHQKSGAAMPAAARAYLEVREQLPFSEPGKWVCVGSVSPESVSMIRIIFPAGSYQLRCVGGPLVVFSQVWDVETQLH